MKVKKSIQGATTLLEATASSSEVSEALNQASIAFCNQNGIRPQAGSTPARAAADQLGIRNLDDLVSGQAIELLVPLALNKASIVPAFSPAPQPKTRFQRGHTFQFSLEVMPKPRFELTDYGPVKIKVPPFKSDESLVDQQIAEMARHYVIYETADPHPIHAGDSCLLKLSVTKDGEQVDNLTSDSRAFKLGQGFMPPGFESGLDGMDVGETRTFTFEGPGIDDGGNVIQEVFEATATLLEVQREVVPVIDDAWVEANMPMYKNLEGLKDDLRANLNAEGLRRYEDARRNAAAMELAKRLDGTIPDEIFEATMIENQQKLRQRVREQGMSWEEFCEQQGGENQLSMMLMVDSRQQLARGYALDAYYRHEGLVFTEEDLDEVCFTMNPRNPKLTRQRMESSGFGYALRESAERLHAVKRLVERADIDTSE